MQFWYALFGSSAKKDIEGATSSQVARAPVEELRYFIQQVQAGQTGSFPTPSAYTMAPSSPKQGWEQAAWVAAQAANQTGGANAYSTMAFEYYQKSLSASASLTASVEQKQEGLLSALALIEPDPSLVSLSAGLRRRIDPTLIGQSTAMATEAQKSALWEGAKGTAWDTGILLQGAAGLVTGKPPFGVDPTKYKMIRYGIYGFVGLSLTAYILGQAKAITSTLKADGKD
jgi:hypothetical protein